MPTPEPYYIEEFSPSERATLLRYVSNVDRPAFAITGLPQVTAAALFARYSRSAKSLRRLLLDEFLDSSGAAAAVADAGSQRAGELFARVVNDYGDDSVAQLGGVHLACEQVSQPLAKLIEWGRLGAYLEQSTRYIAYTDKRDGEFRYYRDPGLMASSFADRYVAAMDGLFEAYCAVMEPLQQHLDATLPAQDDAAARRRALRALALDIARGLLPSGTVSNVGVFASPQAMEQMVLRLRAQELPEARAYAEEIARELRAAVPDFVTRMDRDDRGGVWVDYLRDLGGATRAAAEALSIIASASETSVRLLEWDADGEDRIIAAALYPHTEAGYDDVLASVQALSDVERDRVFSEIVGERSNRRHKPGRGFEQCAYTFEVVSDYGAFRDLQRHRMLTLQWQPLSPALGFVIPAEVVAAGVADTWRRAVETAEAAYGALRPHFPLQAAYLTTLGHRIRYLIKLNAREAMHMIELRTSPQGHPAYRQVCQAMHQAIDGVAQHHRVARAMKFVGSEDVHLPRYAAEAARGEG